MLTVAEAKDEIAEAAGICSSDSTRVYAYCNKAVRRLLPKGKWKGTYQRYSICTNAGCLVWPRQIETIEAVSVCNSPGVVRNQWFEFNPNGPGIFKTGNCNGNQLVDRGQVCTFEDIVPSNKQLRVYCDLAADLGKTITFRGYDDNFNIILTSNGDIEGETVTLANPFVVTTHPFFWHSITQVIKDVTKGVVRVYEYDTVALTQRLIAIYEPDETLPVYRRSYFPPANVTSTGGTCDRVNVDVMAKLRFIPVRKDSDFIMIENLAAICEMIRAIRKFENNLVQEGMIYEALAVKYLNEELQNYLGDGTRTAIHVDGMAPFDSGPVVNIL